MKVEELKTILVEKHSVKEDDIKGKNKSELQEILQSFEGANQLLNSVDPTEAPKLIVEKPEMYSPQWHDYVMSLFEKDELEKGCPRTDALRRVAGKLFGRPSYCDTSVVQTPEISNGGRATVIVRINWERNEECMSFCGAADCFSGNTEKKFANHAVATAETRAEGRALRKALGLTKVVAAEEMAEVTADEQADQNTTIPTGMLNGLSIVCKRNNIDLNKLVALMKIDVPSLEMLTLKHGREITARLSQYQNGTAVPKEILASAE